MASVIRRARKYGNVPTTIDGERFDSKAEAKRWTQLQLLQRAGEITDLRRQVTYPLFGMGGTKVGTWRVDFAYREKNGQAVVEEQKGPVARDFPLRLKLFKDCHPNIQTRLNGEIV